MVNVPKVKLNSGHEMPVFGLGTWQSKPGEVATAVRHAIELGYRHIDCAMAYGNQVEIGEVFNDVIKSGKVARSDLYITSKIWNVFHSTGQAALAINQVLKELQIEYIDQMLIHWPQGYKENSGMFPKDEAGVMQNSDEDYLDTWKAMEQAVDQGKIKSIGVSNFNSLQLQRLIDNSKIKPSYLQIELHPYLQQNKLVDWAKSKGIQVVAYSPLANPTHMFRKEGEPVLADEKVLNDIAAKHNKSWAQVCLRWVIQRGLAVIPKSVSEKRLAENINIFDFELTNAEMAQIGALDRGWRILVLDRDLKHPHYPFSAEF